MRQQVAYALGGNLGDRLTYLAGAVRWLTTDPDFTVRGVSAVYETDAVGGPADSPDYLNAVVVGESALEPRELLRRGLLLEEVAGRERRERWGPRTLDVDLLVCGEQTWHDEDLTLPHPRAAERAFVLVPWLDADPTATIPGRGAVRDLLAALPLADRAGVRHRVDLALSVGQ